MRLMMVRHGQTDWNFEHRLQGQLETTLNETGREQAVDLGKRLSLYSIDRVYVSPLGRARETASLALAGRNLPFTTDNRLSEIYLGKLQGMTVHEASALFPQDNWQYERYGGESLQDLHARLSSFVKERLPRSGTTLLVMHGMSLRMLRAVLLGLGPQAARVTNPPSCCYCKANFRQDSWQISSFGDILHRAPNFGTWYATSKQRQADFPKGSPVTPFATLAMAMAAQPENISNDAVGAFIHDGIEKGVVHRLVCSADDLRPVTHATLGTGWLWKLRKECSAEPLSREESRALLLTLEQEIANDPKII